MFLHEVSLLILTWIVLLGLPVYIFYRNRMVREKAVINYSKKRVMKLTFYNTIVNSAGYCLVILAFLSLVKYIMISGLTNEILLVSLLFLLCCGLTFYGNGIYLTSIVLEAYTETQLRKVKHFRTQFIATHLFHGPISHILIFSGYILSVCLLAILEVIGLTPSSDIGWLMSISGAVLGVAYTFAQIYNGTAPHQFLFALFTLLIFCFLIVINNASHLLGSISLFFISFSVFFLASLIIYFLTLMLKVETLDWDKSGY